MNELQKEAFDAVNKINNEIYKKYKKKNDIDVNKDWLNVMPMLSISFARNYMYISLILTSNDNTIQLPEIILYNSIEDDRIYYEKIIKFETFYKLIKRKFIKVKEELNSIKI